LGIFNAELMLLRVPAILFAVTVHEYMHARVAYMFGDPTARNQGRMTLNPIKHLDVIGTLMLLVAGIGWAKPVPVNPNYFKDPLKHMVYVGLAGPFANFIAAFLIAKLFLLGIPQYGMLAEVLKVVVQINIFLGVFNLIPIPPLDGSKVIPYFLSEKARETWWRFEQYGFVVLLLLVFMFSGLLWTIIRVPAELLLRLVFAGTPVN